MKHSEILAIIPARSGSKSVPHKNIRSVGGKPLLAWSIEHARASRRITRTIVSTDSEMYARVAREYGAEVPFLRPGDLAGDLTPDLDVFRHALNWLAQHEGFVPRLCVHLRPTCPVRDPAQIDRMIEFLERRVDLDSVRTVCSVTHPPHKMWYRSADGLLAPVAAELPGISEPWNVPRQQLPPTFIQTANIDIVRTQVITRQNSMTGTRIYGFLEDQFHDIDTPEELLQAAAWLTPAETAHRPNERQATLDQARSFCFDIDGVIATLSPQNDYSRAQPQQDVIALINELYEAGHHITLFTARGYVTGIDWRGETESQLARWGVRYHELKFGKPAADYYVDDRMLSLDELAKMVHRVTEVTV